MKRIGIVAGVLVAIAAAVLATAALAGGNGSDAGAKDRLTVVGEGSVATVPGRAQVSFTVERDGETAAAALSSDSSAARRMVDALKRAGVARNDVRTDQVSLSPRFAKDGRTVVGYTARNTVSAEARIADVGAAIDAAVDAGAGEVSGPTLVPSERDALYRRALRAAVGDARAKAEAIADACGVDIGAVTSVVEQGTDDHGPYRMLQYDAAAAVPIEPGTQKIEAHVSVTFAIG